MSPRSRYCFSHTIRLVAIACALSALNVRAELPMARLTSVYPPGAKQGGNVEITLTGLDLDEVKSLHFSDARITAKAGPAPLKFTVTIPPEVPVGIYDLRAVGQWGVSNPRAFEVGALPEIVNKPGNVAVASAAPISVGQVINGVAEVDAVHHYKLPLKKGQRIVAQVETRTIDSHMDASIEVSESNGKALAVSRSGGVIDFTAPADADYFLKINDFTYRGGPEFFYRLTVFSGPHLAFAEPLAVVGGKSALRLFGHNLPGGSPSDLNRFEQLNVDVEVPAEPRSFTFIPAISTFLDGFDYRLTTPAGISNAIRIGIATSPVIAKITSPDSAASAMGQELPVPCDVAGRFAPRGGRDFYTFNAPASSVFWIEVISHRLGYASAPFMLVQRATKDDKGAQVFADVQEVYDAPPDLTTPEFRTSARDLAYRLESKEAATYRLGVRNLFAGAADREPPAYRLSIHKENPDFQLAAVPGPVAVEKDSKDAPVSTPVLRRGGVTPIKVIAQRQDGFNGEIALKADNLPAGVSCLPSVIPAGANWAVLLLAASDSAEASFSEIHISGSAMLNGAATTREARPGTIVYSSYDPNTKLGDVVSRRSRAFFASVVAEQTPLTIALAKEGAIETCVFNKVSIPLQVFRHAEFSAPITLRLVGHPLLLQGKEAIVDATDRATIDLDLAQTKFTPGDYTLYVETLTKLKYRVGMSTTQPSKETPATFYSPPIALKITAAPIKLDAPAPVTLENEGKLETPVKITRLYGFADPVEVILLSPTAKGIAGKATIAKDQAEAKLALQVDAATPPGEYPLKLSANVRINNQTITVERPLVITVTAKAPKK